MIIFLRERHGKCEMINTFWRTAATRVLSAEGGCGGCDMENTPVGPESVLGSAVEGDPVKPGHRGRRGKSVKELNSWRDYSQGN